MKIPKKRLSPVNNKHTRSSKNSNNISDQIYEFESDINLPPNANLEEIARKRFFGKNDHGMTGYYILNDQLSRFKRVSNFILKPILHKYDNENNTRILKLENGLDDPEIIEIPSDALVKTEAFRSSLVKRGPYLFFGAKADLDLICCNMIRDFPKGFELRTLGWQPEGFFAYYNSVFIPKDGAKPEIKEYDEAGLVQIDGKWFFSPASSAIFQDLRKDGDQFEKDRQLMFSSSPISFDNWMTKMYAAYGLHSFSGIPYVLISLFKDLVYHIDNNCPHLYLYGESKSGKSKFGESVANVFFTNLKPFSIANGTDAAFAASLARFRNVPMLYNEFDEKDLKEERFQAVKTAYDGEGRERLGKGSNMHKSDTQKVNVTMILMGQYLSTKDDNSVTGRCIVENFMLNQNRPEEQTNAYLDLKNNYENKGLLGGIITELLPYRQQVEEKYNSQFHGVFRLLGKRIRDRKKIADERILRNYSALVAMVQIFGNWFKFPWKIEEYLDWAEEKIIQLTQLISDSDLLKDFWLTVQTLSDEGKILNNHFKIKYDQHIRLDDPATSDGYLHLEESTSLLYIRLGEIHKMYLKEIRKEGGAPLNKTSLISYLKTRQYYVGHVGSEDIEGRKFSCFIFQYDLLPELNLEQQNYPPV